MNIVVTAFSLEQGRVDLRAFVASRLIPAIAHLIADIEMVEMGQMDRVCAEVDYDQIRHAARAPHLRDVVGSLWED